MTATASPPAAALPPAPGEPDHAATPIGLGLVVCLGVSQVVGWGATHYLIAVFAAPMAAELGWSASFVQSGFALALVVMALTSPAVGRWIDGYGGRGTLIAGCLLGAAGCALLALCRHAAVYLAAWVLLGMGMRMALYDAVFATLARTGRVRPADGVLPRRAAGVSPERAMAIVTLFGGLASTVFWPLGQGLVQALGWRAALGVYALLLAASSLLHLGLPRRVPPAVAAGGAPPPDAVPGAPMPLDAGSGRAGRLLFGVIVVLVLFMQTGMAAHFIALIRGLGWDAATAGWVAGLLGIGQLAGRSWVVAWGHRLHAGRLNVICCGLLLLCHAVALLAGSALIGVLLFALLYGAGNGIATIVRGTLPLLLFNPAQYGRLVGTVLRPAFLLAACAPVLLAQVIEQAGHRATLAVMLGFSALLLFCALALGRCFKASRRP